MHLLITAPLLHRTRKHRSTLDDNSPFTYQAGVGGVIVGWDQGCLGMKIGEKVRGGPRFSRCCRLLHVWLLLLPCVHACVAVAATILQVLLPPMPAEATRDTSG